MPVPEDRFTNSVSDAAAYERYRSREDDGHRLDYDGYDGPVRRRREHGCRCLGGAHGPDCPMLGPEPEPEELEVEEASRAHTMEESRAAFEEAIELLDSVQPSAPPPSAPTPPTADVDDDEDLPF